MLVVHDARAVSKEVTGAFRAGGRGWRPAGEVPHRRVRRVRV